jgi:GNAT superfamily N-acetyltransferase
MDSAIKIITAKETHVPSIVQLLAQDPLGSIRENYTSPIPDQYLNAFKNIITDPYQHLMVLLDKDLVIGTFQLSFIQYLTYQGGTRAQIEAVRVLDSRRGDGLVRKMFEWAIEKSKSEGAHVLQLTTDKQRPDALKFYEQLGFIASHEGMKLHF